MTFTLVPWSRPTFKLDSGGRMERGDVSKTSRLFRFRAHRATTLSALLPTISSLPKPVPVAAESHETSCHVAEFEMLAPSTPLVTTDHPSNSLAEAWESGPHIVPGPMPDTIDSSDPLAILRQTLEPGPVVHRASATRHSFHGLTLHASGSESPSIETDDATLIGAKVHCDVGVPGTFLTETMDLEAIAASARAAATATSPTLPYGIDTDHLNVSGVVKKEIVAEVSAVAEQFVAVQQHHAHPQPAHFLSQTSSPLANDPHSIAAEQPKDRRRRRRALISAPIRVRSMSAAGKPDEIATTVDVSRTGILFHSALDSYTRGMEVAVVFPYSQAPGATYSEQAGRVVRVNDRGNGIRAVAITLGEIAPENDNTTHAPACTAEPSRDPASPAPKTKKPLVLAVDGDESLRDALKLYLQNEGYDVIAVSNAGDAREVLNIFTPALIIAEVEGEGTPGYDLCAYAKSNSSLRRVPVVLTTSSAYPSDYSNAHAFGAIVCMAKPYKQERLGHVVRLLAPLPEHLENTVAPHAADPTRVPGRDGNWASRNLRIISGNGSAKKSNGNSSKIRFRFPSFR